MVKQIILISILISSLACVKSFAQDYTYIDEKIDKYPNSFSSVELLAKKINSDFNTPIEKSRAIYVWIANNIKYDVKLYNKIKQGKRIKHKSDEAQTKYVLKKKKAICSGYSLLFEKTCLLCNIECVTISGGVKSKIKHIGKKPMESHAWNAVKVNNEWNLIDVTWGAGSVNNYEFIKDYTDNYFFTNPDRFFINHFPKDTKWLLTDKSIEDFKALPFFYHNYNKADYEIVEPSIGIINIKNGEKIKFKIRNLPPNTKINYSFKSNKKSTEVTEILESDGLSEFIIENELKRNGYLTIFVNYSSLVVYKIVTIP